jgi:hypothetical protein
MFLPLVRRRPSANASACAREGDHWGAADPRTDQSKFCCPSSSFSRSPAISAIGALISSNMDCKASLSLARESSTPQDTRSSAETHGSADVVRSDMNCAIACTGRESSFLRVRGKRWRFGRRLKSKSHGKREIPRERFGLTRGRHHCHCPQLSAVFPSQNQIMEIQFFVPPVFRI